MFLFSSKPIKPRGFTLTELTIVLGVIGVLLGGIWLGLGKVVQAKRIDITVKSIQIMTQQYRDLYSNAGVPYPYAAVDMTCQTVASGFLPQDIPMPPNKTCVTGDMTTYPLHPWGSNIKIVRNSGLQQITTWFYNLPRDVCIQLEARFATMPDVQAEVVNQANGSMDGPTGARVFAPYGTDQPFSISDLDALCQPNDQNFISVGFKI